MGNGMWFVRSLAMMVALAVILNPGAAYAASMVIGQTTIEAFPNTQGS